MVKRDPNKTARNRKVAAIKVQRRSLQSSVFTELQRAGYDHYCNEASLNAFIGSKTDEYIKLRDEVIKTPMEYKSKWFSGLKRAANKSAKKGVDLRHVIMRDLVLGAYPNFKKYLSLFLESSCLKHYEEHYKSKPKIDESEYWFGNNDDEFGLLVTPRYINDRWENDKSEIRRFRHPYWTIAHVMETGLCYMDEEKTRSFSKVEDYLQFFRDMVRRTKSPYQLDIADKYIKYVKSHSEPLSVPLLIPELRYDPHKRKHQHRLDFLIVNPWSLDKYGFEFSPWSTHGQLKGAKRSMSEYNREARQNFENEMSKHKKYWRKFGVTYVIYTDEDLGHICGVWSDIKRHLEDSVEPEQLEFAMLGEFD